MNPILKCCGYYCSCIAILGVVFFGILIGLVRDENPFLVRHQDEEERGEKVQALIIAIIFNSVCFVACAGCIAFGKYKESLQKDEYEDDLPLAGGRMVK